MSQWGRDEAALARRAFRRREIDAAGMILARFEGTVNSLLTSGDLDAS